MRELAGAPAPRYVFANHGDYAYGRFVLDDASRAAVLADVGSVADPFLRALLLDTLWDEVRDARLAPLAYIDLALAQAPRETDELTRREPGRADADRAALVSLRRAARRRPHRASKRRSSPG